MAGSILAAYDSLDSFLDIFAIAVTIGHIKIFALDAEMITGAANLAREKETQVQTAVSHEHSVLVRDRLLRLVIDMDPGRIEHAVTDLFKRDD